MNSPSHDNPFPTFGSLVELQDWVGPLIDEQVRLDERAEPFSVSHSLPMLKGRSNSRPDARAR